MWEYTDKVKDLFLHPKNVGEIKNPDAVGEVGSIVCGDALKLTLKIDKDSNTITDARFRTFGCASAIASSTALTELIKGKTLDDALKVTNKDIADFLGGLPREKMHCSVMGYEALETDEKIKRVIKENEIHTVEDVTNFTKAGGGCGRCVPEIEEILNEVWSGKVLKVAVKPKRKLTNIQKIAMIQGVLETEIRPLLEKDGGDVELVDVDRNKVTLSLRGTCTGCLMADVTAKNIEKKLREHVSDDLAVEIE
jgi:NifU-like protein